MRLFLYGILLIVPCTVLSCTAKASSWSVSPTRFELIAPNVASVMTLRNNGKDPVNVQIRIFRWTQVNGVERLEPTMDVVASPPATRLTPFNEYLVRLVRVARKPVAAEESYRLLVDELPRPAQSGNGVIDFTVRFSVPVFFRNPDAAASRISWSLRQTKQGLVLTATNTGSSKLRLSDVEIEQAGRTIVKLNQLAGYVLGGATMEFPLDNAKPLVAGPVRLKAQSDAGAIEADVSVRN